jgi:cytochrome c peroxidase
MTAALCVAWSGCAVPVDGSLDGEPQAPGDAPAVAAQALSTPELREGHRLFTQETFDGNGRTCGTCHSSGSGTLSPVQIQERLLEDPDDPLFQHDGLDDDGVGTSRITSEATIRITLDLPDYVTRVDDPEERTIDVFRGIPSTLNTPGLDPALMYDLRNETLEEQALGAIHGHAQNGVEPSDEELELIASFQRDARRFYSSPELYAYAQGGPAPVLPEGNTESEKRGRRMFLDVPFNPPSKDGICALCHSGPMLNLTNVHGAAVFPAPPGTRFHPLFVGEGDRNFLDHPVYELLVDDLLGNTHLVSTTDPGVLLTERVLPPPEVLPRNVFVGFFKTPQLWGVRHTAPYFHDNSAPDLEAVMDQYEFFFRVDPFVGGQIELTEQDKADAVAYLKLLR